MTQEQIVILGATGTIGQQTLQVIQQHPERFQVFGLTAHRQVEKMLRICLALRPRYAVMTEVQAANELKAHLAAAHCPTEVMAGAASLDQLVLNPEVTQVMAAIVGFAGLASIFAAVRAGKKVLLANKEALIASGSLLIPLVHQSGACLIPVDSEHNALFQCMGEQLCLGQRPQGVEKVWLTASGGSCRTYTLEELAQVTPAQACQHPNWQMGHKITVDSTTLMNKGLEVLEAHFLFGLDALQIGVLIHPQSAVHGLVQYEDGSFTAGLSVPDMRIPIAHALAWPQRMNNQVARLDLLALQELSFEAPDLIRFPCLGLAQRALQEGPSAMVVLNAANEVAVQAFLQEAISFLDIPRLVATALDHFALRKLTTLEAIIELDHEVRSMLSKTLKVF